MKLLRTHGFPDRKTRGAALLLSFLVLLVIIAIVFQINIVTKTDARVARNDVTLTRMDLAIESALLEVYEMLAQDGEAGAEGGGDGAEVGGGDMAGEAGPESGGAGGAAGGGAGAVDSRMDDWGRAQQTTINDLALRIVIQDEDSKYNVLNMLNPDEEEAQEAYDRVVRIIDRFREDTEDDIDGARADEMASAMRDHMLERDHSPSGLPRASLLTDDPDNASLGFPMSLSEFAVAEPFEERHFRDYFDSDGARVHSLSSFLTVWSAPAVGGGSGELEGDGEGEEDGGTGASSGYAVNLNTAPLAVLASLMDDRDVPTRFWDGVLEYRNAEEEPEDEEDEELEPLLDEFGEEIIRTNVFDGIDELEEVYDWGVMEPDAKAEVEKLLTVQSNVFSIYITARVSTEEEMNRKAVFEDRREQEEYERSGAHLTRTVRSVVWRRAGGDSGAAVVPLLRWEVLDYAPLEVLDYPEDY